MKKYTSFLLMLLLMLAVGGAQLSYAQDESDNDTTESPTEKPKKKAKKGISPVMQALKKAHTFNGKPNKKAKYFIYLQSASWCGPCREEMPKIVDAYKNMKKAGVEIILFSHDKEEADAKGYVKEFKVKFPVTLRHQGGLLKVPGFTEASGIPHATIVDEDGKVLADGHGSIIEQWEQVVRKAEEAKAASEGEE